MSGVEAELRALGPWFQNLRIGDVETAPDHPLGDYPEQKWRRFRDALPDDLDGRSVLDIGCNAGFHALRMKERGAGRVVAIDSDARYLRQAEFAIRHFGHDIELKRMSVYEIAALRERFDLVIFMGVFYHLRHPLLALDLIHEHAADDLLLFQSLQRGSPGEAAVAEDHAFDDHRPFRLDDFPRLHFIEHRYAGDPTNWFIPNAAASLALLRSAGFAPSPTGDPEVQLCRRVARPAGVDRPPGAGTEPPSRC